MTLFQRQTIDLFAHAAQALSVPRSIGEIYGLLFSTEEALPMDEIIRKLRISKGSASQGLRWLRAIGAIRTIYMPGDRRDFYLAETELRKLVAGFLKESVQTHLQNGTVHIDRIIRALPEVEGTHARKFANDRISKLKRWHRFSNQLLPLLMRVANRV